MRGLMAAAFKSNKTDVQQPPEADDDEEEVDEDDIDAA